MHVAVQVIFDLLIELIMKKTLAIIASLWTCAMPMVVTSCSKTKSLEMQVQEMQESKQPDDDPIIFAAIRGRNVEMVKYMLNSPEFSVSSTDFMGDTPLLVAAELGDTMIMRLLLAAGADPKTSDKFGNLVIHRVAEFGHVEAMKLLLASGSDINERTVETKVALAGVAGVDHQLRSAIEGAGGSLVEGAQAIHIAAREGNVEMVKFLIASGADPESKNAEGTTPLGYVDMHGLTDKGDDPRDNRLAVVRIYNPSQQETPPDPNRRVPTREELQERLFGK